MPYSQAFTVASGTQSDLSDTEHVAFCQFVYGRILVTDIDTGSSITLTVYESDKFDGPYTLCKDVGTNGVLASMGLNESKELPTALAGCRFLKFKSDVGGTIKLIAKTT